MSLYDKYFSERNSQHMFSILSDMIRKDTGTDLTSSPTLSSIFHLHYPTIFDTIQTDSLIDMNKHLIDTIYPLITSNLSLKPLNPSLQPSLKPLNPLQTLQTIPEEPLTTSLWNVYSSERLPTSLNRYHYHLSTPEKISGIQLTKITIPEEPTSLFATPTIHLKITHDQHPYTIYCHLDTTKYLGDRNYIIYKPDTSLHIPIHDKDNLKIDILNHLGLSCLTHNDLIVCDTHKQINHSSKPFICMKLPQPITIHKNDIIGLYHNNKCFHTCPVLSIQDSYILCEPTTIPHSSFSILNLSLQNNLTFSTSI